MTTPIPQAAVVLRIPALHAKLFLRVLDQLSNMQSNAGCNDFTVKVSPENSAGIDQLARVFESENTDELDEAVMQKRLQTALQSGIYYFNDMDITSLLTAGLKAALREAGHTADVEDED
jgi:hypothetical protein